MSSPSEAAIEVEGAGEHNLRDIDVAFAAGLTAIVGISGSGKSSLAFDVVYHEARRRLLEALSLASPWSRVPPARVRRIGGLAPAVALGQDSLIRNPNSSVATATGIHPFLRVLYSRFAARICPACATPIEVLTREERLRKARRLVAENGDASVVVPLLAGVPQQYSDLAGDAAFGRGTDCCDQPHQIALHRQLADTRRHAAKKSARPWLRVAPDVGSVVR